MEVRAHTIRHAKTNRLIFDEKVGRYLRETDERVVTRYFGAEDIDGEWVTVTDEYDDAESVPSPSVEEIAERVGYERLLSRLERLTTQRALLDSPDARAAAAVDQRITQLKRWLS